MTEITEAEQLETQQRMPDLEYLEKRVDHQQRWYSDKSSSIKSLYMQVRTVEIITAATLPFVAGFSEQIPGSKFIVGGLSLLLAVIAGILNLRKFQENWTGYRATSEALKREKFLYLTRAEPYIEIDPFPLFVKRVETILSEESFNWKEQMSATEDTSTDS